MEFSVPPDGLAGLGGRRMGPCGGVPVAAGVRREGILAWCLIFGQDSILDDSSD